MLLHVVLTINHSLWRLRPLVRDKILWKLDSLTAYHLILWRYKLSRPLRIGGSTLCWYSLSSLHLWILNLVSITVYLTIRTKWPVVVTRCMHPSTACCPLFLKTTWWHLFWSSSRSHIVVLLVLNNLLWTMDIKLLLNLCVFVLIVWYRSSYNITDLETIIYLIIVIMSYWTRFLMTLWWVTVLELATVDLSGIGS